MNTETPWYVVAWLNIALVVAVVVWLAMAKRAFEDGVVDFVDFLMDAMAVAVFGTGAAIILGLLWPLVVVLFLVWLVVR